MGAVPVVLLALLLLKTAVYTAWCRVGLRWLAVPSPVHPWSWALLLAAGRGGAGLGIGLGWGALLMGSDSEKYGRLGLNPFIWFGGLLVLRWALWSGVSALIQRRLRVWLVPSGRRDVAWRAGAWGFSLAGDGLALAFGIALGGIPC